MTVEQPEGGRDELVDLRAEVEALRKWRKSLLDEGFGYDDSEESAAEVLEWAPIWRAQSVGDEYRADKAEAERDALQRQVDAVRALADEWVKTRDYLRKRSPAGSTRPDQSADRREANALDAAAASLFAALDAVEPADQPHPTPEATVIVSVKAECREPSKLEAARRLGGVCGAKVFAHSTAEIEAWLIEHYALVHTTRQQDQVGS